MFPSSECRVALAEKASTLVSFCAEERAHRPRTNFARDRDSRMETGGRMNTPRERPNTGGRQEFILLDTERRSGLKIRHHSHIGFGVVLIFDSRKGELVRGACPNFQKQNSINRVVRTVCSMAVQ